MASETQTMGVEVMDNPNVRKGKVCPLCSGSKQEGLIACWSCYHAKGLRYGNEEAEQTIKRFELIACQWGEVCDD